MDGDVSRKKVKGPGGHCIGLFSSLSILRPICDSLFPGRRLFMPASLSRSFSHVAYVYSLCFLFIWYNVPYS